MDEGKIQKGVQLILEGVGEDLTREGLLKTPERVAAMYQEVFSSLEAPPVEIRKTRSERHDEMVVIKNTPFYSICEHHLVPFIGRAHLAYIPSRDGTIAERSDLVRVVDWVAKRPQLQERLTTQIAKIIVDQLDPRGVLVVIEAEHLCMSMRGVKKPGALTVTSAVRGLLRENASTRMEAMALLGRAF